MLNENLNISINSDNLSNITYSNDIIEISELKGKEIYHYKMLETFFINCKDIEINRMINIINGQHIISLRFLDWFVTRYCYLYKLSVNVTNSYVTENNFNFNISYKAQLKSFKKKYFDPFRRKKKFYFITNNKDIILTTLGQLNFFRWIITYDIINYTEINYNDIFLKLDHVNSYFKKSNKLIDLTNSSEESKSESTSDSKSETDKSESNEKKYEITNNNSNVVIVQYNKKDYRIPQVSRNIVLEF